MKLIDKTFVSFAKFVNCFSAVMTVIIMALVVLNILMRVIFNLPITGAYEIVSFGILLVVSLALANNELGDGNVVVTVLLEKMSPKKANAFSIAMYFLSVILMGVVTYQLFLMITTKYGQGATSPILLFPHWIIVAILTLGFLTLFFAVLIKLIRMIVQHRHLSNRVVSLEEKLMQAENISNSSF